MMDCQVVVVRAQSPGGFSDRQADPGGPGCLLQIKIQTRLTVHGSGGSVENFSCSKKAKGNSQYRPR